MKRISEQDFENTLSKIYQAALDPSLWEEVLLEIGVPLNAHGGQLFAISKNCPSTSFDLICGLDDSAHDVFDEHLTNGSNTRANYAVIQHAGNVVTDYSHTNEKTIKTDPYYQSIKGYDADYYGGLVLSDDPSRFTAVATLRAKRFGNLTRGEVQYLQRLVPHLQRSMELMQTLGNKGALCGLLTALENLVGGALVIDYRGQIAGMNTKAATILARGDGIFERDKHVVLSDKQAQRKLNRELRNTLAFNLTGTGANSHYIRVDCRTSLSPYILYVSPIRMSEDYFRNFAGIIYITDPHCEHETLKTALMEVYGLTVSEAELVEYLCEGRGLKEFAEHHNISIEAPRYHLKNIFQKMNVRRQSELVALVMKTMPSIYS